MFSSYFLIEQSHQLLCTGVGKTAGQVRTLCIRTCTTLHTPTDAEMRNEGWSGTGLNWLASENQRSRMDAVWFVQCQSQSKTEC